MKLIDVFAGVPCTLPPAAERLDVCDLVYDSRKITPGCAFVCLRGAAFDGHDFAAKAVELGAAAVIAEEPLELSAPVVVVSNTREALALTSANFFRHPAREVKVIGLTGTKGKTTTAAMLQSILTAAGHKVGVIGTLGIQIGGELFPSGNTTPESYEIEKNLRKMADAGCTYCVLEASSIGLQRYRAYGFPFEVGVFTNFSQDHIGGVEHKDMEEYLWAKSLLFTRCKTGIINIDDPAHEGVTKGHTCALTTYGCGKNADLYAADIARTARPGFVGMSFTVKGALEFKAEVAIPGVFNVYNALSAIACCRVLGIDVPAMQEGLATVMVKGRVEPVPVPGDYSVFIDYAHNAVSMTSILTTLREYDPKRLVCLFGAGGNRPVVRRYEMGEVSGNLADLSVLTTDNPRNEDPQAIIDDIKIGMAKTKGKFVEIVDRREAIRWCLVNAQPGDIIVLAGKGQEDYLEIKGVKYHFDEREVIRDVLDSMK